MHHGSEKPPHGRWVSVSDATAISGTWASRELGLLGQVTSSGTCDSQAETPTPASDLPVTGWAPEPRPVVLSQQMTPRSVSWG